MWRILFFSEIYVLAISHDNAIDAVIRSSLKLNCELPIWLYYYDDDIAFIRFSAFFQPFFASFFALYSIFNVSPIGEQVRLDERRVMSETKWMHIFLHFIASNMHIWIESECFDSLFVRLLQNNHQLN